MKTIEAIKRRNGVQYFRARIFLTRDGKKYAHTKNFKTQLEASNWLESQSSKVDAKGT